MPGIQMHAVIATVPDPVHSHLAPEFDRAIDALIGAASDNHYLISYSWLPWRVPKSDSPGSGPLAGVAGAATNLCQCGNGGLLQRRQLHDRTGQSKPLRAADFVWVWK